jgi:hypothetical protein
MEHSQLEAIITQLINRVVALENEVKELKGKQQRPKLLSGLETPASIQHLNPTPNEVDTIDNEYPSVEDAPKWDVRFVINTSKGSFPQSFIQKAFTEKQAIYLARTHQLFDMVNKIVKAKQIEPKWKVENAVAEKID